MACFSYDISVCQFWFAGVCFPGVSFHSRLIGACSASTDSILRVNCENENNSKTIPGKRYTYNRTGYISNCSPGCPFFSPFFFHESVFGPTIDLLK